MSGAPQLEGVLQAEIRKAVGLLPHTRLFRNPSSLAWVGRLEDRKGAIVVLSAAHQVHVGLTEGASDLIGLTQVVITPEMVGRTLAVFTAAEVKRPRVTVPEHQQNFINFVLGFGGLAGVVRSPDDALALVSATDLIGVRHGG